MKRSIFVKAVLIVLMATGVWAVRVSIGDYIYKQNQIVAQQIKERDMEIEKLKQQVGEYEKSRGFLCKNILVAFLENK